MIDPGEAEPVLARLQADRLALSAILVTHHHADHTGGIQELRSRWDVPVFGPAADNIAGVTAPLADDETFDVPGIGLSLQALATPGHTRGQAAYYAEGMVFTGDTLFSAGCGRLFEGSADQMWRSLDRLRGLPGDTRVYCGHEYTQKNLRFAAQVEPNNKAIEERRAWADKRLAAGEPTLPSTIGDELEFNPFLRPDHDEVRVGVARKTGSRLKDPVAVFAALRDWKDHY